MANGDIIKYFVMGTVFLCGYIVLFRTVSRRTPNRKALPYLGVVLFLVCAVIAVPLMMVINSMGNTNFVILVMLLLISFVMVVLAFVGIIRHFRELDKRMLIIFILYLLMVSYITIFSRSEGHSTAIMLRFDALQQALRSNSLEPLQHALLNALMFIPLGALFPTIWRGHLDRFSYVFPLGLTLSTIIETTQMLLKIGQCDVEDIVANTLGAVIGLILYKLFIIFFGHRLSDEDEEDEEDEEEDEE